MADFRAVTAAGLNALAREGDPGILSDRAVFTVSDPFGSFAGAESVATGFAKTLRDALTGCHRRDLLVIGGQNIRAERGTWVATVTHYVGTFAQPLHGITPNGKLVFLRSGEFYRLEGGKIVEARIIIDLLDLLRQCGRMPLPHMLGSEITFPAPATQDGLCPATGDGAASLDLIQAMLGDLHVYDPNTASSPGQTGSDGYWADDMLWYGPAGVGSNFRWDGFVADHRAAFLDAFPDRHGGNHFCRIGDGNYAAISGWPSMTMTHAGPYLGQPGNGEMLTLRVMDFYRCADGKIAENWVLLDYLHLFSQMGRDLLAEAA